MKPHKPVSPEVIRNLDRKVSHRPVEERLAIINDFLKLKLTEVELFEILTKAAK